MRVLIDTNILFSAIAFPNGAAAQAFSKCILEHDLVIPTYVIDELKDVFRRKFPDFVSNVDKFLEKLSFELVYTPDNISDKTAEIRDEKDYPILYSAIIEDVDVLLTGDKDFKAVNIEKPKILTPAEFLKSF
ncbi:MAG: putative toxin-antitoxin system toxin component, PIN family [Christensenellaceae bacterium]